LGALAALGGAMAAFFWALEAFCFSLAALEKTNMTLVHTHKVSYSKHAL
jgi:hypothetical protein